MKQIEKLKNLYFYNLIHEKYEKNIERKISSCKKKNVVF